MYLLAHPDSTAATAAMTNEDTSFPATNILSKWRKDVAKSTTNGSVFTITATDVRDIVILNTNALSGHITVNDGVDDVYDAGISFLISTKLGTVSNNKHIRLNQSYANVTITLTLAADATDLLSLGIVLTDEVLNFGTTLIDGLAKNPDDYSVATIKEGKSSEYEIKSTTIERRNLENYLAERKGKYFAYIPSLIESNLKDYLIDYGKLSLGKAPNTNPNKTKYSLKIEN